MIKMKDWIADKCQPEEIITMIQGVATELLSGNTNWSVYVGGNVLIFGTKAPEGPVEIYHCEIKSTNLDEADTVILSRPPASASKQYLS